jgi:hypothetical protein
MRLLSRLRSAAKEVRGVVAEAAHEARERATTAALDELARRLSHATMINLKIEPAGRRVTVHLELEGELTPVEIAADYRVETVLAETRVAFSAITASRVWMNALVKVLPESLFRVAVPPRFVSLIGALESAAKSGEPVRHV